MSHNLFCLLKISIVATCGLALVACSGSSSNTTGAGSSTGVLPLVTPIIKTALPTGLGGVGGASKIASHAGVSILDTNVNGTSQMTSDVSALQSRFFSSAGPTEILAQLLLSSIRWSKA